MAGDVELGAEVEALPDAGVDGFAGAWKAGKGRGALEILELAEILAFEVAWIVGVIRHARRSLGAALFTNGAVYRRNRLL
jgi:hypothetical protein